MERQDRGLSLSSLQQQVYSVVAFKLDSNKDVPSTKLISLSLQFPTEWRSRICSMMRSRERNEKQEGARWCLALHSLTVLWIFFTAALRVFLYSTLCCASWLAVNNCQSISPLPYDHIKNVFILPNSHKSSVVSRSLASFYNTGLIYLQKYWTLMLGTQLISVAHLKTG